MPITILPKEESNQQLFAGLGSGLSGVLKGLEKRQQRSALQEAGFPAVLASLPPQVQAAYLKQYGAAQQLANQRQQALPRAQGLLENLKGLQQQGQSSSALARFFGGYADPGQYDLYAEELKNS